MKTVEAPRIVSRTEWLEARKAHLAREKEITRLHDQIVAERRQLPWTKVEKNYRFQSADGARTLAELFDGRSQLFIYHFMMGPEWEAGCKSCSFFADHVDGPRQHFERRDVKFAAVARAPIEKIEAYRARMGWTFSWVSSYGTDFNADFAVSFTPEQVTSQEKLYNFGTLPAFIDELPGASVFAKDDTGTVYHTYSTYARGLDVLLGGLNLLDFTPRGRDEGDEPMSWVRRHDEYADAMPAVLGGIK